MKNYFTLDENFENIIKNSLSDKNVNKIDNITTGWTNIVYEAETNDGNYFFRFPRDDFWARTIEKDVEFANFLDGKTRFKTVRLERGEDENRPFSIHKEISGVPIAERMNSLSQEDVKVVAKEISEFMYELHTTKFDKDNLFKTSDVGTNLVDFLNELLDVHVADDDKKFWKYKEFAKKENDCLVHGDLNSSNILVDENNHVTGIIDFGFSGFGNKYYDIARILSRECAPNFKEEIIKSYEQISNEPLDLKRLDEEIKIWQEIDSGYIKYMRKIGIYE